MAVIYVCDGCGKKSPPRVRSWKPAKWYERKDEDGEQHACSRKCIDKVSKETGKTGVVLPI